MKKIIAIIRNDCVKESESALFKLGITGIAVLHVRGRGRQNNPACTPDPEFSLHAGNGTGLPHTPEGNDGTGSSAGPVFVGEEHGRGFLKKGMLMTVVSDEDVLPVVQALITVNQSGRHGDGKIFICPMVTAIEIGNGECGNGALS